MRHKARIRLSAQYDVMGNSLDAWTVTVWAPASGKTHCVAYSSLKKKQNLKSTSRNTSQTHNQNLTKLYTSI